MSTLGAASADVPVSADPLAFDKPKNEPRDPNVTWLEQEVEEGNVEYKYRVLNPNAMRLQQLITQMKFRLSEGKGECFYYVGVEDDGYPRGLDPPELSLSIATLAAMARTLRASATPLHYLPGGFGRRCALVHITFNANDDLSYTDLRVAVAGSMDAGKSTLVAVLTHGQDGRPLLDNGRGSARMSVFRHKHEIESGHTSSISQQMVGYDEAGSVLNYAGVSTLLPAEISAAAARVCTFIDMGGHEKCLKTALYGLTCMLPDYMLLCVCATARISRITREHLAVALALEVPVAVVVTKADAVDDGQLQAVLADIRQLLATAVRGGAHSTGIEAQEAQSSVLVPVVAGEAEAAEMAVLLAGLRSGNAATSSNFCQATFPVFVVSCVTGAGLATVHAFLGRLQPAAELPAAAATGISPGSRSPCKGAGAASSRNGASGKPRTAAIGGQLCSTLPAAALEEGWQKLAGQGLVHGTAAVRPVHFQVLHTFDVEGVGSVVWGTLVSGTIEVGQVLMWGPNADGGFTPVTISGIQRLHIPVRQVRAGQTATLALQPAAEVAHASRELRDAAATADSIRSTGDQSGVTPTRGMAAADEVGRPASALEAALLDTAYREAAPALVAPVACSRADAGTDEALEEQMLLEALEADDKQGPEHWRGKPAESAPQQRQEEEDVPTWYLADSAQVTDSESESEEQEEEQNSTACSAKPEPEPAADSSATSTAAAYGAGTRRRRGRRGGTRKATRRGSNNSSGAVAREASALVSESSSSFAALEALALQDTLLAGNTGSSGGRSSQQQHSDGADAPANLDTLDFDAPLFGGLTDDAAGDAAGDGGDGADFEVGDFGALDVTWAPLPARHCASCGNLPVPRLADQGPGHSLRTASTRSLPACIDSGAAAALGASPPASPRQLLGSSPPNWRKGAVLLDAAMEPETLWAFEAVLVLLGGTWPPRGLLSGCWPPSEANASRGTSRGGSELAGQEGGSVSAAGAKFGQRSPSRQVRQKKLDYTYVVHCNSVRQVARVEWMQEVAEHDAPGELDADPLCGGERQQQRQQRGAGAVRLPSSIRAAAALLQAFRHRDSSGGGEPGVSIASADVGSVVVARFRFVHRPEWLKEGARLIVRDRSDGGHFAAAGYITALLLNERQRHGSA